MEIKEAQTIVDKRIQELGGYWHPLSMFARLTEEVGELARAVNVKYGEKKTKHKGGVVESDKESIQLEKELADVQFTLLAIANRCGVDVDKALSEKMGDDYEIDKRVYGGNQ